MLDSRQIRLQVCRFLHTEYSTQEVHADFIESSQNPYSSTPEILITWAKESGKGFVKWLNWSDHVINPNFYFVHKKVKLIFSYYQWNP